MSHPPIPQCLALLDPSDAACDRRRGASGTTIEAMRLAGLSGPDRLLSLSLALAMEVQNTASGEECETLTYLEWLIEYFVGERLAINTSLAAITPAAP